MGEKIITLQDIGKVRLVKNSRAKRVRITVSSDETRVSLPTYISFRKGEYIVSQNREWVIKSLKKIPAKKCVVLFRPGVLFSTPGYQYKLTISECNFINVEFNESASTTIFYFPKHIDFNLPEAQKALKYTIDETLRKEAQEYLPLRVEALSKKHGFAFNRIAIKNNRSSWGSCSNLNNINLNLHLMRLPKRIIDMVIVHELVHTKIKNHGASFKSTMKGFFYNLEELEKELKQYSPLRYLVNEDNTNQSEVLSTKQY